MPAAGLIHLIYYSTATREMDDAELMALLQQSRKRNTELRLTGMLLYGGGVFLQAIEGLQAAVDMLYQKIARDPRHHSIIILEQEPITTRSFPDWSMGFQYLSQEAGQQLAGAFSLRDMKHDLTQQAIKPGLALELLQQFASTQR